MLFWGQLNKWHKARCSKGGGVWWGKGERSAGAFELPFEVLCLGETVTVIYLTWTQTNLCRYLIALYLLSFFPLVREHQNLYPTWISVDMLIQGDLNLRLNWMLIWQPVTLWYRTLNLHIAKLLNSFLFLNKPLSCLLWALRWVVNGARKSFSGHLLWFFTYDQLGNRRISDAHTRKILLYLLQRTS